MLVDDQGRRPISAAEIAAFLGITASAVRHIVRRNGISPVAQRGHAKLYWMHEVKQHSGTDDRLAG